MARNFTKALLNAKYIAVMILLSNLTRNANATVSTFKDGTISQLEINSHMA
jgi:histone deacetylase complex regulatory component SIN3